MQTGEGTEGTDYTRRLEGLSGAGWKRRLNVQLPYRWNIRRLAVGRVLDVGCGSGRNLGHLDDAVGVDHNPTSISVARSHGLRAWTTQEWAQSPDAVDGSFDTMLLAHVLEHVDRDTADEIIRSYLQYLAPAARLILICPQERGYATDSTHVRFVDFNELRATSQRAGFHIERSVSFPLPRAAGRAFPYNEFVTVAARGTGRPGA